ncbi:3-hydroxylacyl-ACP dehydratase [Methylococcus sp. EFPC2]|nr:3-hydroxylacyl-ACP dehydratase [Methylococcus sp. EFPC2]
MVLLDRILEVNREFIVAELVVRSDGLFYAEREGGLPAWIGIELMAQTVAAYSGYWRLQRNLSVDLGFLLGTRHYESSVATFPAGVTLRIRAEKEIEGSNGLAVFDCGIEGENLWASAKLNVFLPADSRTYLTERGL